MPDRAVPRRRPQASARQVNPCGRRTKIVYVTDGIAPWVVGGMQAVARRQITWLSDAGFAVTAVASRADMPSQVDFAETLVSVPWPKRSRFAKVDPWHYVRQLHDYSVRVRDVIDRTAPDLVYAEGPFLHAYLARRATERVPVIFHPHGLEMYQTTGSELTDARLRLMRPLVQHHTDRADVTISQGGRLDTILFRQLGMPRERCAWLPNCAPIGFEVAEAPRRDHAGRFLFVGRDVPLKGLSLLVNAVSSLPDAQLNVVGASGRHQRATPNVRYLGEIRDAARLADCLLRADFLVVPSYTEGMPTVILEAISAGLPVIATDVGAVSKVIRHGESGFLIPPGDTGALAEALERAAGLSARAYRKLSARALDVAREDFAPDRVRHLLLEIVERALRLKVREHKHIANRPEAHEGAA